MGLDEAAHLLCIAELMFTGSINHHHTHSMRSPAWQHVIPPLYHYSDYAINQFQHHHPVSLLWMNPVKAIQMECAIATILLSLSLLVRSCTFPDMTPLHLWGTVGSSWFSFFILQNWLHHMLISTVKLSLSGVLIGLFCKAHQSNHQIFPRKVYLLRTWIQKPFVSKWKVLRKVYDFF